MKIKQGDNVIVTAGKDKGKEGKVTRAIPADNKVIIEGVNTRKRHQRARRQGQKGQIIEFSAPIDVSNVSIKDPKTGAPSRIGYKMEGSQKVRVAKKSNSTLT